MTRPQRRSDLAAMTGYHSPQVDVAVRLNTNESPEPPPAAFVEALADAASSIAWHRYPDRQAMRLREAIGHSVGCNPASIFVANGSNEVLQTVLLTFAGTGRTCLTFEPTYALHSHLARLSGASVVAVARDDDFELDATAAVDAITSTQPAVTFLCSPNNPTGLVEDPATVSAVLAAVESVGGLLVMDEAYGEFSHWSAQELLAEDRSLVVVKTFSKTWAMAGARLGYLLGPEWLVDELAAVVLPYHLDSFKQQAGIAALGFRAEMERRVLAVVEERRRVEDRLEELGARVWPSGANFVLFRAPLAGDELWEALVGRSILVRNTASWDRLEGCLRVTIGTPAENDRFLDAIADILAA